MRADKPRRAAEPEHDRHSSEVLRTLAKRGAIVALISGIGLGTATAFGASSATATALGLQSPLSISTLGGGLSASPNTTSAEELAAQRSEVLDEQAQEISSAAADAAATIRTGLLTQDASSLATENDRLRNLSKFMWPTKGGVGSRFGLRLHPILHIWRMHDGDDIGGTCGQPIWAAQSGTVTKAEMGYNGGSGNNVWIDNGDINGIDVASGYLHMKSYLVKVGQYVNKGDVIGYVGSTGLSTACHLHFSIKKNGAESDPMEYIGWNSESTQKDAKSSNE
jgi:murein DD-endopeptidase MepM/ murein hydrolase activator NlpD